MSLNFDKYARDGKAFINNLASELGNPDDKGRAARVLKAVLHAVRDSVPPQTAVYLLSQLPYFLKGAYAENWTLKPKRRIRHRLDLIQLIIDNDRRTAYHDFINIEEVENAVGSIFLLLADYVSNEELQNIRATVPPDVRPLIAPFPIV